MPDKFVKKPMMDDIAAALDDVGIEAEGPAAEFISRCFLAFDDAEKDVVTVMDLLSHLVSENKKHAWEFDGDQLFVWNTDDMSSVVGYVLEHFDAPED